MKMKIGLGAVFAASLFVLFNVPASRGIDNSTGFALVKKAGEITQVFAGKGEAVLFESEDSREAIEWALANKPIAVVGKGRYLLSAHIAIPRSHVSLIIAEGAELVTRKDAAVIKLSESHGGYFPLIYNGGNDHVNVLNFGALNPDLYEGEGDHLVNVCVVYDGRCGGTNGISGGMIFSCGKLLTSGDAVWIVDSEHVEVPLLWSKTTCNTLCVEGSDYIRAGTIAELNHVGRPKGTGRYGNEAIDLNSHCRNFHCELAIGTGPLEEVVDVNNSPDGIFEEIRIYGSPGNTFRKWIYKPSQRRLTQKAYIDHSDGTVMLKEGDYKEAAVRAWVTEFEVIDLLENLPTVTVKVKLTGEFKDQPAEEVLNKTYTFDLSER